MEVLPWRRTGEDARAPVTTHPLPIGTVTLLLGEVEVAGPNGEPDADHAGLALARVDELVHEIVDGRHGGVRPTGPSERGRIVAAFRRPTDAAASAIDLQLALAADPGCEGLEVRMALHSGDVQLRDGDRSIGVAVGPCARLRDLAHGGQILVAGAATDLLAEALPPDVQLVDLGSHRPRDLGRPERVHQLRHPALRADFPPLRSLDAIPNNLPLRPTAFVGRAGATTEVVALLASHRIVTLSGAGGCGKTRLALQIAGQAADRFPDGVWLLELGSLEAGDSAAQALAALLGVREHPVRGAIEPVAAHLGSSQVLLVVDHCEHLVGPVATLVAELLARCPALHVLATSREPLDIGGEIVHRVPSLSLPAPHRRLGVLDLADGEAVGLFVDRARLVRPNIVLDDTNADAVARICEQLDGIPLAIELVAARTRNLTPYQICNRLADRFRLLADGTRTALPRQQTLLACVAWTHDLLGPAEQLALRRLSVFHGGFTLDAAEVVLAGDGLEAVEVLDLVASLVGKALVVAEPDELEDRYRLHETVRAFAADRLTESGERSACEARHRAWCAALVDQAAATAEPDQHTIGREVLRRELPNVRAAAASALAVDDGDALLALASIPVDASAALAFTAEHRRWLRAALALHTTPSRARARALLVLGELTAIVDVVAAAPLLAEAREIFAAHGDAVGESLASSTLALAVRQTEGLEAAVALHQRALDLARRSGDDQALGTALGWYGQTLVLGGTPAPARPMLEEATGRLAATGDVGHRILVASCLGLARAALGEFGRARDELERLVDEARPMGSDLLTSSALVALAIAQLGAGHPELAVATAAEALAVAQEGGETAATAPALYAHGSALLAAGCPADARADLAACHALQSRLDPERSIALPWLALAASAVGDHDAARALLEPVLEGSPDRPPTTVTATARWVRALVASAEGDDLGADTYARAAAEEALAVGAHALVADTLEVLAASRVEGGAPEEGTRLLAAAAVLRDRLGYLATHGRDPGATGSEARRALGDEPFASAWADGARLGPDEAVAVALRGHPRRKRRTHGWGSLTPAELEIVRLVAKGLTNPQIAEQLFVARETVKAHLSSVFAKLGVSTRAELAAQATRRGI